MKTEQELDALFAGMREEAWPAERLVEWRERVRPGRARRRFGWFWLLPAPALAAALFFAVLRPQPEVATPVSIARAPAAPTVPAQPARVRAAKPEPPAVKATEEGQTEFIRVMTDDPDVVILWAVNGNGEAR
jgi:hypothetical protein